MENTPPSIEVVTTGEATADLATGGDDVPAPCCVAEHDSIPPVERPIEEQPCEVRKSELARSPSRSSSERSYGGTLKLPCLSRQTSDDDDEDSIEVGSEVSGKSNSSLLRQLSPRFIRKLTSKKSVSVWNTSENATNGDQSSSSAKSTPGHSRNTSVSSICGSPAHAGTVQTSGKPSGYLIGLHRKLVNMIIVKLVDNLCRNSKIGGLSSLPCF